LDDEFPFPAATAKTSIKPSTAKTSAIPVKIDDRQEEYYAKLRKHKRYKARGNITIVFDEDELIFPLNDYSAGGLSFLADRGFQIGHNVTAALKYNASGEVLVMDFEIIVRGVFEQEKDRFKIGCEFIDDVDEELWHTIMGQ
jgi:hypothetical protein